MTGRLKSPRALTMRVHLMFPPAAVYLAGRWHQGELFSSSWSQGPVAVYNNSSAAQVRGRARACACSQTQADYSPSYVFLTMTPHMVSCQGLLALVALVGFPSSSSV